MDHPRAGVDYPRSVGEFQAWFSSDADCLDDLAWFAGRAGSCSRCGHTGGWRLGDGRFKRAACGGRTSVTAHDLRQDAHASDRVVHRVLMFASGKDGISH